MQSTSTSSDLLTSREQRTGIQTPLQDDQNIETLKWKAPIRDNIVYSPYLERPVPRVPIHVAVRDALQKLGPQIAMIDGNVSITAAQLIEKMEAYAATFRSHGVKTGDRICCHLSNGIESFAALYGVIFAGAVAVLADDELTKNEVLFYVKDVKAEYVLTDKRNAEKFEDIRQTSGDRYVILESMAHAFGFYFNMYAVCLGATIVVTPMTPESEDLADLVDKHKPLLVDTEVEKLCLFQVVARIHHTGGALERSAMAYVRGSSRAAEIGRACRTRGSRTPTLGTTRRRSLRVKPARAVIRGKQDFLSAEFRAEVECEAEGSLPPALVSWWLDGVRLNASLAQTRLSAGGNVTTSLLGFVPRARDNGRQLRCVATNPRMPGHDQVADRWVLQVHCE
ncbi:hypothetical protein HPB49_015503 [Dermacentor silvarum]|uniref:Uncharacterized protein n=1 Tax=Dermacentor silvarum TaxID=543639 RepID=A0ACB8C4A8_DERSI|nr:hypothetical protein HPB49_015503 [Dermacentor silvarum]